MFLKLKVFAAILASVFYSLQLDARQYSGSYNGNYIGDSENPMMSDISYNLTVYDVCNLFYGYCIHHNNDNVYVQAQYCITQSISSNLIVGGLCPYFPTNLSWCSATAPISSYYSFPARLSLTELTNFTCGRYNREGLLCGKCKPGYGPAVYAFSLMCEKCEKCSSNSVAGWTLYLFLVLFPITVFYIFVIIFNIRATAPPFTAFVLLCQTYCMIEPNVFAT